MLATKYGLFFCWMTLSCLLMAQDVKIAVGQDIPPYVIRESDSGIELDIAREALLMVGHKVVPAYLPFGRVMFALEHGDVDAALTVNEDSGIAGVHYSDSHISYQNVAIALKEKNFNISHVASLQNNSVLAFQYASRYLGKEFELMAKKNVRYSEKAQQNIQISKLYLERVEIIVLELAIFKYFKKLESRINTNADIDVFELFPLTPYKVGFLNEKLRNDFNIGLKALKKSGRYDEIVRSYVD